MMILPILTKLVSPALGLTFSLGVMLSQVHAQTMTPGSALVFPEIDGRTGVNSYVTVTNVNSTEFVRVLFTYVDGSNCSRFEVSEALTPRDSITVLTGFHGPPGWRGYLHVRAVNSSGDPITFNSLTGSSMIVDGIAGTGTGVAAFSFQGLTAENALTDLNGNGALDFDGVEYEAAPDRILIPRFIADDASEGTELFVLSLNGGPGATTTTSLLIYNDNEEVFSAQHSFACWSRTNLADVSLLFTSAFLVNNTNHDPNEPVGLPQLETGWFQICGTSWSDLSGSFQDPAILAFAIERPGAGQTAELPFLEGDRVGGALPAGGGTK